MYIYTYMYDYVWVLFFVTPVVLLEGFRIHVTPTYYSGVKVLMNIWKVKDSDHVPYNINSSLFITISLSIQKFHINVYVQVHVLQFKSVSLYSHFLVGDTI